MIPNFVFRNNLKIYKNYVLDRFPDRIDGRCKSSLQDMPIVPINVLAKWS